MKIPAMKIPFFVFSQCRACGEQQLSLVHQTGDDWEEVQDHIECLACGAFAVGPISQMVTANQRVPGPGPMPSVQQ